MIFKIKHIKNYHRILVQKDVIDMYMYIDIHLLKLKVLRHALTSWFLLREHDRSWGGRDGGEAAIPGGAVLYAAADRDVPLTVNQIYIKVKVKS